MHRYVLLRQQMQQRKYLYNSNPLKKNYIVVFSIMSTNLLKMTNFWIFYKKAFKFKFICDKMALVKLSK